MTDTSAPLGAVPGQPASVASFGGFTPSSPFTTTSTADQIDRVSNVLDYADPTRYMPQPVQQFLGAGEQSAPRVYKSTPENMKALNSKYAEMRDVLNGLPEQARNAIIDMDSQRVASGAKPLTREQTLKLIETYTGHAPATPAPRKKVTNVIGNTLSDLGTILKSIPQLPSALVHDFTHLGQKGEGEGLTSILTAPGIRLIPGAYTAANISRGTEGLHEALTHPLMTALDVLPAASEVAKLTPAGKLAVEGAEAAGKTPRPLAAALTQRVEDGALVDRLPRQIVKDVRDSTSFGQTIDATFGGRARETMRRMELARMQVVNAVQGLDNADPGTVEAAAKEAAKLNEKYQAKYGWDENHMIDLTARMQRGDLNAFTPEELSYINEHKNLTTAIGEENVYQGVLGKFGDEFYPVEQARTLRNELRRAEHFTAATALRNEWRSGGAPRFQPSDLHEFIDDALNRHEPGVPAPFNAFMVNEMRAVMNVMDRYGYDVKAARGELKSAIKARRPLDAVAEELRARIDDTATALRPRPTPTQLVEFLQRYKRTDTLGRTIPDVQAQMLADAIARGDSAGITKRLDNIFKRKSTRDFPPTFREDVRALRDQYADDRALRRYTDRSRDLATQRFRTAHANTPAARYQPLIGELTREGWTGPVKDYSRPGPGKVRTIKGANEVFRAMEERHLNRALTADEVSQLVTDIKEQNWSNFRFGDKETVADLYAGIEGEVKKVWLDLRRQGLEPSFIHQVGPSKVRATLHPQPGPIPVNLSQTMERAIDVSPGAMNAGVAVSHQAVEVLMRRSSEMALDDILQRFGVSEQALRDQYRIEARSLAEKDPLFGFTSHMRDIIGKRYTRVDPKALESVGFNWKSARLTKYSQDAVFLPNSVFKVLEELSNPHRTVSRLFDPVTRVFRMSVIGLSPRVQVYNILGGATMLMGETGPGAFKYMAEAMKYAKDPATVPEHLAGLRQILGSQTEIMKDWGELRTAAARTRKAEAIANVAGGRTLGRLWNEVQQSKALGVGRTLVEKSYELNALFDDTYRAMGYLYGYDKALTKGLSREVAERAGIETLQKVMMDWAAMTPLERNILKPIFPFYSFMNHAIRYVFRYPVDHPLRAGVLGAFGRAQEADLGGLLPERMLGYFLFGHQDSHGRQQGLNIGPINPFGDVANMLTISGFLSATNPVISTMLESVGLSQGQAELYPSLRYDAASGRLVATRSNPLLSFVENTIPQAQILTALTGINGDFQQRMRTDPEAAIRTLWSAGGLPLIYRGGPFGAVPVVQEEFKAELARQQSQDNELNAALRSGSWQNASRYPGLAGVQQQISALPSDVLAAFTPPEQQAIRAQLESLLQGKEGFAPVPDGYRELLDQALTPAQQETRIGGI